METIYGNEVDNDVICNSIDRIINQTFKLLPTYEEDLDWVKPLETLMIEVSGFSSLFPDNEQLFKLACNLQGLLENKEDLDFMSFRRKIFECCSVASKAKNQLI